MLLIFIKTAGNSQIIETITAQSQEKFGNFYGETVVGKWDDKILQMKEQILANIINTIFSKDSDKYLINLKNIQFMIIIAILAPYVFFYLKLLEVQIESYLLISLKKLQSEGLQKVMNRSI